MTKALLSLTTLLVFPTPVALADPQEGDMTVEQAARAYRIQVYERFRETLRNAPLLWVEGRVQRAGDALSVLVRRAGRLRGPE